MAQASTNNEQSEWRRVPIIDFCSFNNLKKILALKDLNTDNWIDELGERRLAPEVVQRIKQQHDEKFKRTIDRILNQK